MILNGIILAQLEGILPNEGNVVSTSYKLSIESLCGGLILLLLGIVIGIFIAYKNIRRTKSSSHHRHHHSSRSSKDSSSSKSASSSSSMTITESSELKENKEFSPEAEEQETSDEESSSNKSTRHRHRRREHRPKGTSLSEAGSALPPERPPGVPPPATIKRDDSL